MALEANQLARTTLSQNLMLCFFSFPLPPPSSAAHSRTHLVFFLRANLSAFGPMVCMCVEMNFL